MSFRAISLSILFCSFAVGIAQAQPKLPFPPGPDNKESYDTIEGGIWEYRAKLEKNSDGSQTEKGKEITGKFRIEGSAVFDVSPTFKLPTKKEVDKVIEKVKAGEGPELKLPSAPQQKRIGDIRTLSGGRTRIDFNDKDSLHGIMIVWKKKKSDDVFRGTYSEREGTKTVRSWEVIEVRPIED